MATQSPVFFLSESQTTRLRSLASELEQPSLLWASGYLAGLASAKTDGALRSIPLPAANEAPAAAPAEAKTLTIIYGSQTGNAKRVAEKLAQDAQASGLVVNLHRADSYKLQQLKKERFLYVVISTHSEGDEIDPPDDSRNFIEFLESRRAPKLPDLRYAVLALGDTSYPDFCGIGRKVDERLEALGASRLQPRGDADVDIETVAKPWAKQALENARQQLQPEVDAGSAPAAGVVTVLHPKNSGWTRDNPFTAEILSSQPIVGAGSVKDVHHIELSLEGSGISYQPGDALGVWPQQAADLVAAIIAELGLDGAQEITRDQVTLSLADWLTQRRELTLLTRPFITAHAERGNHDSLHALLRPEAKAELAELLANWQLLDFLRRWPVAWDAEALIDNLRPLAPRMYSIASSQQLVGEEVHLTIERLHYQRDGEDRWGVASRYLCGLAEGETAPVFVDGNDRFRLPKDPSRDIILIGPGTGIAPFRAFVQEREETGAEGRTWLFFGNPNRRTDFLYQLEWQQAVQNGSLTKLSVAFSRDQEHKIYVQDRLREHAAEVWGWLEGGAHLYLCGDADRMAPDVHAALQDIAVEQGGLSKENASLWIKQLMADGRYARDVY